MCGAREIYNNYIYYYCVSVCWDIIAVLNEWMIEKVYVVRRL